MHYLTPENRFQLSFASSLDELIGREHPVRILDALIEAIIESSAKEFAYKGNSELGRKAYSPATLLKLFVYGYLNSISSSRKLEVETQRNIEVKWLLGNLTPDHKTISDFRKNNGDKIRLLTLEFRKFLKEKGYIKGETVAVDGSKIKANANREMLTMEKIERRIKALDTELEDYLKKLQHNDICDELREEIEEIAGQDVDRYLLDKITKLQEQVETLSQQKKTIEETGMAYISPSDEDARLMRSRDGKIPAYNLQAAVDAEYKMIAAAEITTQAADVEQLSPMLKTMEEQIAVVPATALADTGYYNPRLIQQAEKNQKTKCYIPVPRKAKQEEDKKHGITFSYHAQADEYECSEGKKLILKQQNKKRRGRTADVYQGIHCSTCRLRSLCTQAKNGRIIHRYHDEQWALEYQQRMQQTQAKQKIKLRKTLSEHPFGTLKYWMGKIPLKLRGKKKVQTEIDLYTTGYNFKRLVQIISFNSFIEEIKNYRWLAIAQSN
jgi:transposase